MSLKKTIRKGVNIRLAGIPANTVTDAPKSSYYSVQPPDFTGLTPKMNVKEGDAVEAGSALFHDKNAPSVHYTSPVSGTVSAIVRGAKRRVLSVEITPSESDSHINFSVSDLKNMGRDTLLAKILEGGMFPFFRQRPYDVIANPADSPRSIHISGFDSSPLAATTSIALDGRMNDFQNGINALSILSGEGGVHIGAEYGDATFKDVEGCTITEFQGPHPAGNVGVQIHHTMPVNKGEVVWTIGYQDVANLGGFLATGKYIPTRVVACGGSECSSPAHVRTLAGASIKSLVNVPSEASNGDSVRIISGNVLTGSHVGLDGFLGAYHTSVALISEGNEPKFLLTSGWLGLGLSRFSLSKDFPTWLMPKSKTWNLDTNMGGEERAFVVSGEYEKVFPFDIYPVHLLKSIIVNDIDSMEKLGIYEVAPEDFALCEFGCTSKIEAQKIIREGLDSLRIELS